MDFNDRDILRPKASNIPMNGQIVLRQPLPKQ
jgi:hypothetical protein